MYLSSEPAGPAAHLIPSLLTRTGAVLNRVWRDELREHGVTIARWQVLSILAAYDGARVGELARMSGAEQATTTRVVDQMERDGLVERRETADDGRVVEVWRTRSGKALFKMLLPEAEEVVSTALHGIDEPTARTLMDALVTIMANLGDDPLDAAADVAVAVAAR